MPQGALPKHPIIYPHRCGRQSGNKVGTTGGGQQQVQLVWGQSCIDTKFGNKGDFIHKIQDPYLKDVLSKMDKNLQPAYTKKRAYKTRLE